MKRRSYLRYPSRKRFRRRSYRRGKRSYYARRRVKRSYRRRYSRGRAILRRLTYRNKTTQHVRIQLLDQKTVGAAAGFHFVGQSFSMDDIIAWSADTAKVINPLLALYKEYRLHTQVLCYEIGPTTYDYGTNNAGTSVRPPRMWYIRNHYREFLPDEKSFDSPAEWINDPSAHRVNIMGGKPISQKAKVKVRDVVHAPGAVTDSYTYTMPRFAPWFPFDVTAPKHYSGCEAYIDNPGPNQLVVAITIKLYISFRGLRLYS